MSDFKASAYADVAALHAANKTAFNNFAKGEVSISARWLAAIIAERIQLPGASVEKVIDNAYIRSIGKADLQAQTKANLRQKGTKALRFLAQNKSILATPAGSPDTVVLARIQTVLDAYTLNGLARSFDEAKAALAAPKVEAKAKAKVEAAEAAHQEQRQAREAVGLAPDETFDVLTLQKAIEALCKATDDGFAQGAMIEAMIEARLYDRRMARQQPLQLANAA